MNRFKPNLKTWLSLTVITFLILVVVFLGLPAPLLILRVPSFAIGGGWLWILRWQNDADGFGIRFNLVPLLITAIVVGTVGLLVKLRSDRLGQSSRNGLV
ncbi:hypothetical protein WA1_00560 [Scytonema hofmannii PCC 7110]|uniref:Uncharacterized protein n=1 Tax=Scytonema hofmannii PCC 7110 TaxID=128403 RepID=A0A139XG67_9CYAN|nr:hypothetical protein [Scytonema hofmannii]KYC43695.1 hypothetical protein WA1_00560 [Scytonema hofmannii PCC 7110]